MYYFHSQTYNFPFRMGKRLFVNRKSVISIFNNKINKLMDLNYDLKRINYEVGDEILNALLFFRSYYKNIQTNCYIEIEFVIIFHFYY